MKNLPLVTMVYALVLPTSVQAPPAFATITIIAAKSNRSLGAERCSFNDHNDSAQGRHLIRARTNYLHKWVRGLRHAHVIFDFFLERSW